jgi:hypothetical protein
MANSMSFIVMNLHEIAISSFHNVGNLLSSHFSTLEVLLGMQIRDHQCILCCKKKAADSFCRASEVHIKLSYMGLIPIVVDGLYLATKLRAHLMV